MNEQRPTASTEPWSIEILVDADAMPKQAMVITKEVAKTFHAQVTTVSSIRHELHGENHVTVDASPQATDMEIVRRISDTRQTVVITQDYGLAALALTRRATAISPSGRIYTTETIDDLLAERAIHARLRHGGRLKIRGPKPRSKDDDRAFEAALTTLLGRLAKEE